MRWNREWERQEILPVEVMVVIVMVDDEDDEDDEDVEEDANEEADIVLEAGMGTARNIAG